MFTVYRKCEKSLDNLHGIVEVENPSELDKPFLFCLAAQESYEKSVFGVIKEGARAARVRTTDEYAGGFKIDEMPVYFLGALYKRNNIKEEREKSILDDFIYPFIKKGNNLDEMIKRARMINFLTYCDATKVYVELEKRLIEKLSHDGLSDDDINKIVSQIGVVSIASEVDVSKLHANTVLFKDANDREVFDFISKTALKKMEQIGRETIIGSLKSNGNVSTFVYNGEGIHELREYLKDENIVKSALCAVVSKLLENSAKNMHSDKLLPITNKELLQTIIRYNGEFRGTKEYLDKIDSEIDYDGATKYTKNEDEMLTKLEKSYKQLIKARNELESANNELESERKKSTTLMTGIKEKCSDVAFEQIVVKNGYWNANQNTDKIDELPTDRQIREQYEQMIEEQTQMKL